MKYKTSFTDNFNKFFNNETYLPSVSLDSEWFSENSLEKIDQKAAETARGLFSNQEVQEAFSESLVCSEEALQKRVNVLTKHGFRVMSSKLLISTQDEVPFPSVIEHNDLPGMVFKTGAKRVENDEENNFLKNDIFFNGQALCN